MVAAMARYSASAVDLDIVDCFLAFHEIKESPKRMQKPVMDFLVSGHAPQSASEKAFKCNGDDEEKNRPWPGLFFRYRKR